MQLTFCKFGDKLGALVQLRQTSDIDYMNIFHAWETN